VILMEIEPSSGDTEKTYIYADSQIIAQYDDSKNYKKLYIYGNYIDEAVIMNTSSVAIFAKFYVHDHLYSPVALVEYFGSCIIRERYEYDAYGNCHILEPNFADDTDGISDYNNPYLFTGRRVDYLNNGSLKIQYNRNRYYDQYTGRFLTHDPLGITPNPQRPNTFDLTGQYSDGMNLYEYAFSDPVLVTDQYGLRVELDAIISASAAESIAEHAQLIGDQKFADWEWESGGLLLRLNRTLKVGCQQAFRSYYTWKKFDANTDNNRFVYTCKGGWIDLGHYSGTAFATYVVGPIYGLALSYGVEFDQEFDPSTVADKVSAFSVEDLYSNYLGMNTGRAMNANLLYGLIPLIRLLQPYDIPKKIRKDLDGLEPVDPGVTVSGRPAEIWLKWGALWTHAHGPSGETHLRQKYLPKPVKMPLYHSCVCDEHDNSRTKTK